MTMGTSKGLRLPRKPARHLLKTSQKMHLPRKTTFDMFQNTPATRKIVMVTRGSMLHHRLQIEKVRTGSKRRNQRTPWQEGSETLKLTYPTWTRRYHCKELPAPKVRIHVSKLRNYHGKELRIPKVSNLWFQTEKAYVASGMVFDSGCSFARGLAKATLAAGPSHFHIATACAD